MAGPLAGLRVLDLSTTFSGPYCTLLLSDLGADVLKVEAPGGDTTRVRGTAGAPGRASVFVGANRGKRSIELNIKEAADLELLLSLSRRADVFIHNMRESAVRDLGIDYDAIRRVAPRLVYCTITGFGSDGPYAGRPAYDDTIQALTGLAWQQGQAGTGPTYMATAVADKTAGLMAALSIASAMYHRARTGQGQYIEVPMFEAIASWALVEHLGGRAFVPPTGPTGYERQRQRRLYWTKDGVVSVVVYHDGHWTRFLSHVGMAELMDSPGLRTPGERTENVGRLYEVLSAYIAKTTTDECLATFAELDIPAERVLGLEDLFDDAHLAAVDFFQEVSEPGGTTFLATRAPMMFTESTLTPPRDRSAPAPLSTDRATVADWLDRQ